jgi:hypothetical protein
MPLSVTTTQRPPSWRIAATRPRSGTVNPGVTSMAASVRLFTSPSRRALSARCCDRFSDCRQEFT